MAFARHATSKLYTEKDLFDIKQLASGELCEHCRCEQNTYDQLRVRQRIRL